MTHCGRPVRTELFSMGMWDPRPSEEVLALRRLARGRRPRQEEPTSAWVPEREAREGRYRHGATIICAAGDESDSDMSGDDVMEVRGGVAYYHGVRPRLEDEGVEEDAGSGEEDDNERCVASYHI